MLTKNAIRVAIVADLLEEGWPSMDLMADMLMAHGVGQGTAVSQELFRPSFPPILPFFRPAAGRVPPTAERIVHRFWSYPRWIRRQPPCDVYHIVDHSYAHLVGHLPPGRVVVTCHDTDAFRTLIAPGERESTLPGWLVRRVLDGLRSAAAVVCVSNATRAELLRHALVDAERTLVVPNGVHPACSPLPDPPADAAAAALVGEAGPADLLHVGSTIPRKRIDVLLELLALVAKTRPDVRLWRAGGPFTPAQSQRARELGVDGRITVLPFLTRPVLAALYRRAALVLLPSDREGFGLPVLEAMACGTPIVCSDLPVLREVAGDAAEYCAVGAPEAWAQRVLALLHERDDAPERWASRRSAGVARAATFSWQGCVAAMHAIYGRVHAAAR